jgi:hypothetical protein
MNRFFGNWRITEMEQWDQDYIDLEKQEFSDLAKTAWVSLYLALLTDSLIVGMDNDKDAKRVEFSRDCTSEYDPVCGRGWFEMTATDQIYGKLFIHNGDESWVKVVKR